MILLTNAAHAMEDKGGILEFSLKDVMVDSDVNREKLDLKAETYVPEVLHPIQFGENNMNEVEKRIVSKFTF